MAYSKDNSGSLSKNERKEKETHPDLKGKATINGVEFWISGWRKENDRGTWYSLSFEEKDAKPAQRQRAPARAADPDIPF